jgi:penicillin-binding protein-related factor A (putative recombinase)
MPVSKKTPLEKDVQNSICEYLKLHSYFFWRNNTMPVFSRNNAGNMAFRSMGKYAMKGLPDIILIFKGKFVGIEVKRQGINALRPEQIKFQELCIAHGAIYVVVHSLEELVDNLKFVR